MSADELALKLAKTIDALQDSHDLGVMAILTALETIRYKLTEAYLRHKA